MTMNDRMSDFVARINNAILAEKNEISVLKNNLILRVTKKLVTLGYIESFTEEDRTLELVLNLPRLTKLKRMSKPGQRVFVSYESLPKIVGGKGYNILTTSKGVITNVEAKRDQVGGELLFQIY